jgi:hypothetical protein
LSPDHFLCIICAVPAIFAAFVALTRPLSLHLFVLSQQSSLHSLRSPDLFHCIICAVPAIFAAFVALSRAFSLHYLCCPGNIRRIRCAVPTTFVALFVLSQQSSLHSLRSPDDFLLPATFAALFSPEWTRHGFKNVPKPRKQ